MKNINLDGNYVLDEALKNLDINLIDIIANVAIWASPEVVKSISQPIYPDRKRGKGKFKKGEIVKMNRYGKIYTLMLIATAVSAVPLFAWLGVWAVIPWGIIWAISLCFAFKLEKVKKTNDVQTYKEIVAFSEGKRLDDIQKQREIGKRPYQKILLVIGSALITFVFCAHCKMKLQ